VSDALPLIDPAGPLGYAFSRRSFCAAMDVAASLRLGEVMTTLQLVERVRLATGCARRSAERAVYMLGEFGVLACCGRRRHGGQLWTPADGVRSV